MHRMLTPVMALALAAGCSARCSDSVRKDARSEADPTGDTIELHDDSAEVARHRELLRLLRLRAGGVATADLEQHIRELRKQSCIERGYQDVDLDVIYPRQDLDRATAAGCIGLFIPDKDRR